MEAGTESAMLLPGARQEFQERYCYAGIRKFEDANTQLSAVLSRFIGTGCGLPVFHCLDTSSMAAKHHDHSGLG